jgi:hypothetical protein
VVWQSWAGLGGRIAATRTDGLLGSWTGEVRTKGGSLPMHLAIGERGATELTIGDADPVTGTGHVSGDVVFATLPASIPTPDTAREEHHVILDLRLRDDRLVGPVYAESTRRPVFWYPFYAQLARSE